MQTESDVDVGRKISAVTTCCDRKYQSPVDGGQLLNVYNTLSLGGSLPLLCSDQSAGNDMAVLFSDIVVHDRKLTNICCDSKTRHAESSADAGRYKSRSALLQSCTSSPGNSSNLSVHFISRHIIASHVRRPQHHPTFQCLHWSDAFPACDRGASCAPSDLPQCRPPGRTECSLPSPYR